MYASYLAFSTVLLASLSAPTNAQPLQENDKAPLTRRVTTDDYGRITVEVTSSKLGTKSVVKVQDSVGSGVNGVPVPNTDQSTTCSITKISAQVNTWQPCANGEWDVLWNTGAKGQPDVLTVRHHVKYQSSEVSVLMGSYSAGSQLSDNAAYHTREASQIPIFLNGAAPAKEYMVCERVLRDSGSLTFSFINGRGPLADPQICYAAPPIAAFSPYQVENAPGATNTTKPTPLYTSIMPTATMSSSTGDGTSASDESGAGDESEVNAGTGASGGLGKPQVYTGLKGNSTMG